MTLGGEREATAGATVIASGGSSAAAARSGLAFAIVHARSSG